MKRLAFLLGVSLFMACGDDGNNNNTPVCGDGLKTGSEQCDDGNTTSGDGCSSTCTTETAAMCGDHHVDTGEECDDGNTTNGDGCSSTCMNETANPVCGDHHTDPGEQCDDGNTTNGDGCSSTCQNEPPPVVCGNGMVETGEMCDDGNTTAGDGCNATCQVELGYTCTGMPSVCTQPPGTGTCAAPFNMPLMALGATYTGTGTGDTSTGTNQVDIHDCDSETGTNGAGAAKDQLWKFVNPVAQKVVISLNNHVATPSFDGVLRLMTVACDITTQVPDSATHADGCSDVVGSASTEVMTFNNLAAGTYYVLVDGFGATAAGMYSLTITGGVPVCGNNVVEPGEGCDDHNTTAGDGCGATCGVENGYSCAGSPSVCTLNCGNGTLQTGESCDDMNTTAGDGCSATCTTESGYNCTGSPSVCTFVGGTCASPRMIDLTFAGGLYSATETGDTTNTTSEVAGGVCDNQTNSGGGHDQTWKFVNPVTQPVLITLLASPATTFDGAIRLMTTACDVTTQVPDDVLAGDLPNGTHDGCADLHSSSADERLNYNSLPAGTYYLVVDGFLSGSNGTYTFKVQAGAVCGDGTLSPGESCDDGNTTAGDGCGATCGVEAGYTCAGSPSVCTLSCGNGVIDAGEECDAGGTTSDRCNATCHLIFDTTDTEGNNDAATAQVLTPVHHIIKGSLPVGDLDVFKFTLAAPATVEIETYTTYEQTYTSGSVSSIAHLKCSSDTEAGIYSTPADVADDALADFYDDDDGDGACSYIGPLDDDGDTTQGHLTAGTYYFVVHEYASDDAIAQYMLDFKVTP